MGEKKVIWIINEYAGSPYHGMVYRHYYLAKEWVKRGLSVYIITASYSHLFYNLPEVNGRYEIQKIDGINYVWVKVPSYKNSYDKRRILKWLVFALKLFRLGKLNLKKPDVILVSPSPHFPVIPALYFSRRCSARLIYEIRDIWPLTLVEMGGFSEKNLFILAMKILERFAYRRAHYVVSVLPGFSGYLRSAGIKNRPVFYIPNGFSPVDSKCDDCETVEKIKEVAGSSFIVGYVGKLGESNALEYLVQAASFISDSDIKVIIVGDGMKRRELKEYIKKKGLENVFLFAPVPKSCVKSVIKMFDVCYIGLKRKNVFKYGISSNKLFEYMYYEKPVIFAYSGGGNLVEAAKCGICVSPEDPVSISEGIIRVYKMPERERVEMGVNGRKFVERHHLYSVLADNYLKLF